MTLSEPHVEPQTVTRGRGAEKKQKASKPPLWLLWMKKKLKPQSKCFRPSVHPNHKMCPLLETYLLLESQLSTPTTQTHTHPHIEKTGWAVICLVQPQQYSISDEVARGKTSTTDKKIRHFYHRSCWLRFFSFNYTHSKANYEHHQHLHTHCRRAH